MDDVKPRLTMPPQRDPDYYDDDGNVVFCAQDVLFRVRGARARSSTCQRETDAKAFLLMATIDTTLANGQSICSVQEYV